MLEHEIKEIVAKQKEYFLNGNSLDIKNRIKLLKKLKQTILKHEKEINDALKEDLGKSDFESYMTEIGMVLSEISYMIKHVKKYTKKHYVKTPLAQFHAKSFTYPSPYGVVLIMSPWNYPFMLSLSPLVNALSAGNTLILKPSAYSPKTSEILKTILNECFDESVVYVVLGGRNENQYLLKQKFDYIFFTGGINVGKEVMKNAADHLTPITLELGGKSPCIVDESANIELSAKRIVFGKFLNCGQTCVAPDYVYVHENVKDRLVQALINETRKQFGDNSLLNDNYGKIINEKHFERITGLINTEKVVFGGKSRRETLQIDTTIMDNVTFDDSVMQEEIFGPLLPVVTFKNINECIEKLQSMEHPLALYLFTKNKNNKELVLKSIQFGGGCINDTIIHLATSEMAFGGVGQSGTGSYHGKKGFETFSHYKSIVDKKLWIDLPMRYQPYTKRNKKLIKMFLK